MRHRDGPRLSFALSDATAAIGLVIFWLAPAWAAHEAETYKLFHAGDACVLLRSFMALLAAGADTGMTWRSGLFWCVQVCC